MTVRERIWNSVYSRRAQRCQAVFPHHDRNRTHKKMGDGLEFHAKLDLK